MNAALKLRRLPKPASAATCSHRQRGGVDQPLGALNPRRARDRCRRGAQLIAKQLRQMAGADAESRRERLDAIRVQRPLLDQAQRPGHRRRRPVPRRRPLRRLGPAAQARAKTGGLRRARAAIIADIFRSRLTHAADRPAIDARRGHADEEDPVIGRIARIASALAGLAVEARWQVIEGSHEPDVADPSQ